MASFLPGVAYPGVRDNRSTINTKTGYEKKVTNQHDSDVTKMYKKLSCHRKTARRIVSLNILLSH